MEQQQQRDLGALSAGDAHAEASHKRDARKKDVYFADMKQDSAAGAMKRTIHENDDAQESDGGSSSSARAASHDRGLQTSEVQAAHRDVREAGGVDGTRLGGEREAVRGRLSDSGARDDSDNDDDDDVDGSVQMRARMEAEKARGDAEKREREREMKEKREREAQEKQERELREREEKEKREREEKLRREKEEQERQEAKRREEEVSCKYV